jgi:hypothetical protein
MGCRKTGSPFTLPKKRRGTAFSAARAFRAVALVDSLRFENGLRPALSVKFSIAGGQIWACFYELSY